jgi:hypothetical protein
MNLEEREQFKKWMNFLENDCSITNAFFFEQDRSIGVWTRRANITGDEYERVFEKMYPNQRKNEKDEDFEIRKSQRKNFFTSPEINLILSEDRNQNDDEKIMLDYIFGKFWKCFIKIKNYEENETLLNEIETELKEWVIVYEKYINPTINKLSVMELNSLKEMFQNRNNQFLLQKGIISNILNINQIKILKSKENNPNRFFETLDYSQKVSITDLLKEYKPITPYIHEFVFHIPEFLRLYKDVNIFNTEGLEKLNDFTTEDYFKSTNRKFNNENRQIEKIEYIRQLMNKKNRVDLYQLNFGLEDLGIDDE